MFGSVTLLIILMGVFLVLILIDIPYLLLLTHSRAHTHTHTLAHTHSHVHAHLHAPTRTCAHLQHAYSSLSLLPPSLPPSFPLLSLIQLHCTPGQTVQQVIESEMPEISHSGYQVYQFPSRALLNPEKEASVLQDQEISIEPMRHSSPGKTKGEPCNQTG